MSTNHIRLFLSILDEGGVTNAARAAGVSQPAFSAALRRFEDDIGVKLFHRTPGGLTVTTAGQELVAAARRVSADYMALSELADELAGSGARVSVAVSRSDPHVLPLTIAIRLFRERYGTTQTRLSLEADSAAAMRAVETGKATVGILSKSSIVSSLNCVELPMPEYVLVLPGVRPRRDSLEQLSADGVLPFIQTVGLPRDVPEWFARVGITVEVVVTDAVPGMVMWLVEQGIGAAVIPLWLLLPVMDAARAWFLPLPDTLPQLQEPSVVVCHDGFVSRSAHGFIQIMEEVCAKPRPYSPGWYRFRNTID